MFPEPPVITSHGSGDELTLDMDIVLEGNAVDMADETLGVDFMVLSLDGSEILYYVEAPPGATTASLSSLPSGVNVTEVIGHDALVLPRYCESDEMRQWCVE